MLPEGVSGYEKTATETQSPAEEKPQHLVDERRDIGDERDSSNCCEQEDAPNQSFPSGS
jgi:hypothetical protein